MLLVVPSVEKSLDCFLEVGDAAEDATADRLAVDDGEPGLNLVHPTRTGGREMQVYAWVLSQPCLDVWMLVSAVVVENEMKLAARIALCDHFQEL